MAYSQATILTKLQARYDAILLELSVLDDTLAGGKPNAAGPNAVDHVGYKRGLYEELGWLKEQIDATQSLIDGPIEVVTEGFV